MPKRKAARKKSPIPVTERQVQLLRDSFALIEPHSEIAALVFYRNLFTLDSSLRALFHTSIELQARKLMDSLRFTVSSLESPETLVPALEALGRRHVTYGTKNEHYDTVLRALMLMLEQTLAGAFTAEVREAWDETLTFVANVMKRGAESTTALKAQGWILR